MAFKTSKTGELLASFHGRDTSFEISMNRKQCTHYHRLYVTLKNVQEDIFCAQCRHYGWATCQRKISTVLGWVSLPASALAVK